MMDQGGGTILTPWVYYYTCEARLRNGQRRDERGWGVQFEMPTVSYQRKW